MNNVKLIRKQLKLSQQQLGACTGYSQGYIGHVERGRRNLSSALAQAIYFIAKDQGVNCTLDNLFFTDSAITKTDCIK